MRFQLLILLFFHFANISCAQRGVVHAKVEIENELRKRIKETPIDSLTINQYPLLKITGLESNDEDIGIRVYIDYPEANESTSTEITNYLTTLVFSPAKRTRHEDFVIDIDEQILGLLRAKERNKSIRISLVPISLYSESNKADSIENQIILKLKEAKIQYK